MIDLDAVAQRWNRAISLRQPTLGDLTEALGGSREPVFPRVAGMFYASDNVLMRVHPGLRSTSISNISPALSVGLIVVDDFFAPTALIRTENLPRFRLLGASVPCVAQSMLAHLHASDPAHVSTATEVKRLTIHYGKALSLVFMPDDRGKPATPDESSLKMIEYFFSMPYEARIPASISMETM